MKFVSVNCFDVAILGKYPGISSFKIALVFIETNSLIYIMTNIAHNINK